VNRDLLLRAMVDWNFWYRDRFTAVPREYSGQVLDLLGTGEAITILGVKRAGKSTIITQVAKVLVDSGVNPLNFSS